jgi:hypothetical protein
VRIAPLSALPGAGGQRGVDQGGLIHLRKR